MSVQIGVFAKHWTPGKTKTRLASTLGASLAAECSQKFLQTTLVRLSALSGNVESRMLAFTPSEQASAFADLTRGWSFPWQQTPQPAGDLGEKMTWFFEQAFQSGHQSAMLLGSDSPDFPTSAVEKGLQWLSSFQNDQAGKLVLGPATDGGYWCVGATGIVPPIFGAMPWSQPNLMESSLEKLNEIGWSEGTDYLLLDEWYDIDHEIDLRELQKRIDRLKLSDKEDPLLQLNHWIQQSLASE